MAQMVRCRVGLFSIKFANQTVSRLFVPVKYQRSWFHTSWILDVKGKELLMPSLSPTMESGTIVKWLKKEGDNIQAGDAVADIQTDKAVVTMEMDDEGVLAKIIVTEGTKDIKVGTLIALTVEEGQDWKSVELPSDAATSVSSASATTEAAPSSTPAISSEPPPPGQQNIAMPALSPTMTSGTIVKWLKKEGDEIEPGDALADIQTDKAVMSFELDEEAILAKILIPEGSQVEVGQLIAITMEKGSDWKTAVVPTVTKAATAPTSETTVSKPSPSTIAAPAGSQPPPSGQVYGLAVKRLLEEYDLSSGSIKGTGRPNRLLKSDVLAHIEANHLQKVTPKIVPALEESKKTPGTGPTSSPIVKPPGKGSPYIDIEVSNIRAVIAKRLGESKANIPHSYATVDVQIDKLNELRSKLKADNVNVSVNDLITKAVAHALLECPDVNSLYQNGQVIRAQKVDISVAVSTPTGLITPIVFDTPSKSLADIASNIRDLAGRAREGKLKPQEFQGGSFTISNLGMFGIKEFSAIINPPQTAILAVGGGRVELGPSLTKSTKMTATLSYDARAIDEDQAAEFLTVLRSILEEPVALAVAKSRALRHRRE